MKKNFHDSLLEEFVLVVNSSRNFYKEIDEDVCQVMRVTIERDKTTLELEDVFKDLDESLTLTENIFIIVKENEFNLSNLAVLEKIWVVFFNREGNEDLYNKFFKYFYLLNNSFNTSICFDLHSIASIILMNEDRTIWNPETLVDEIEKFMRSILKGRRGLK